MILSNRRPLGSDFILVECCGGYFKSSFPSVNSDEIQAVGKHLGKSTGFGDLHVDSKRKGANHCRRRFVPPVASGEPLLLNIWDEQFEACQ